MNAINTNVLPSLSTTAELLLKTAERLYAEHGLGVVSTRQIAREAGQKNHSAISYHFGGETSLIEAILDFRMTALDQKRFQLYEEMQNQNALGDVRLLLNLVVQPLAEELLRDEHESYYISLLAQLINRGQWQQYFVDHPNRTRVILQCSQHLIAALRKSIPEDVAAFRLSMMGPQVVRIVADWDAMRRRKELDITEQALRWRVNNLVDYLAGALQASHTS
ncbi:TetR/AcrR family transcriptional regulator [Halieaceae bacterium]|jgi:AcrR family transcriptional regulator|nr:TetR/AcrR family transcriptional regulator [Halieaceae bacterium]